VASFQAGPVQTRLKASLSLRSVIALNSLISNFIIMRERQKLRITQFFNDFFSNIIFLSKFKPENLKNTDPFCFTNTQIKIFRNKRSKLIIFPFWDDKKRKLFPYLIQGRLIYYADAFKASLSFWYFFLVYFSVLQRNSLT
jgi:hypothetical protein